jgi:hypothetical protein
LQNQLIYIGILREESGTAVGIDDFEVGANAVEWSGR